MNYARLFAWSLIAFVAFTAYMIGTMTEASLKNSPTLIVAWMILLFITATSGSRCLKTVT